MSQCPRCGAGMIADGEAHVNLGVTVAEIIELLNARPSATLVVRLLRALRLLNPERATRYAATYGILI